MLEVLLGAFLGSVVIDPFGDLIERWLPTTPSWEDNTHYHSGSHSTHISIAHGSHSGHFLNVACYLPAGHLEVFVDVNTPIVLNRELPTTALQTIVDYRVNKGDLVSGEWSRNSLETLIFAPDAEQLALWLLWADSFFIQYRFGEHGELYEASFDLRHAEDDHPMIPVLAACGVYVLAEPTPGNRSNQP